MRINFTKMHGAGNDFVVIDLIRQSARLNTAQLRHIADRQRGIGCDQILLVEPPSLPDADFRYRIYNADGSEAGQCGNGARCFARFVRDQRLTWKKALRVETTGGMMGLQIHEDGRIYANLGEPVFIPEQIPFTSIAQAQQYELEVDGRALVIGALSMGNPHAVLTVDNINTAPVAELGPVIERHPRFPERVNVGFMEVVTPTDIRLRVYERGAGETQACGTGACAAVVYGICKGLLADTVTVQLPGGKLSVSWRGEGTPVWLGGPTATVFEGVIRLRSR